MKEISWRELVHFLLDKKDEEECTIYFKDEEDQFHVIQSLDLLDTRIRCEDGEWTEQSWLKEDSLWIKIKQTEEI